MDKADIGNVRETFFMNQLRVVDDPITSDVSDFMVRDYTFEVGGRNKKQKQIRGVEKAYVVKDDIEYGGMNVIPLWMFGMMYWDEKDGKLCVIIWVYDKFLRMYYRDYIQLPLKEM